MALGHDAIDANPAAFTQWAHSLHDVGAEMLNAIDAGEKLDSVCEGCHMTFWYPNQVIPEFAE